ncbi:hypothetical protein [Streptomyces odontomachi]|uniref:hypothetical protein n=1 Tax=Streptomyces odontomachi TaxID=2944940 RepID=UPI00210C9FF9|nr:hypothetical protein [Streptomyces sp. ODS25]
MSPTHPARPTPPDRSDAELAELDVPMLLRYGLTAEQPSPLRTALYGDGAVGAAVVLDRLGTQPRSVAFLAETVRAAGLAAAVELPAPLPHPEAAATVRPWLEAAASLAGGIGTDESTARWLKAVAAIIELRQRERART